MTMTKMKGMGRQASAARASCNCPFLWPFYHSRRTGEIPSLTAWQPNESSGCVYGSQCGYGRFAGQLDPCGFCGRNVHVACMRRHPLLSGWLDKRDRVAKCFDCALYNGVMFETASPAVYKPYYEQIDWRNRDVKQSSLTLGALWALELLTPYGDAGANERCESCNKGEDLLACSLQSVLVLQRCLPQHTCVLGLERAVRSGDCERRLRVGLPQMLHDRSPRAHQAKTQAASAEKEEQEIVAGRGVGVCVVARW